MGPDCDQQFQLKRTIGIICDVSLPSLIQLGYWCNRKRTPPWYRGHLGNDPQWTTGFLSCCSGMFPLELRKKSELVGSEEVHRV